MLPIKIKVNPKDFIVEEIADLKVFDNGEFGLYILEKEGYGTLELIKILSKKLKIPLKNFSYGGRKDKYGHTIQYITIKSKEKFNIKNEKYSMRFLGYTKQPMQPLFISSNKFRIIVRDLKEDVYQKIVKAIDDVKKFGYPNYFDDQRFGSYHQKDGFLAEKILKKHYSGALKIYLTSFCFSDKAEDKERKNFFYKNWGNWQVCLQKAKTDYEKRVFSFLKENPKNFIYILQRIPKDEMSLFFSAYQSYLWNILISRLIKNIIDAQNLKIYKGLVCDYVFYETLDENTLFLKDLFVPLPSKKSKMPSCLEDIYLKLLSERQIKVSNFDNRKIRQAFFKPISRQLLVIPQNIHYEFLDDTLYKGKQLTLSFILPRGSYATMFLKRLFSF